MKPRVILGVTGASGAILGLYAARALRARDIEVHMIVSEAARLTWELETGLPFSDLTSMADVLYENGDTAARIASGSFRTMGMLIVPCSMKTLAGIVTGYAENLILRAADVCLKENRRLVLCPREMPLGKLHLRNLSMAADLGCTIIPPMMSFYSGQRTVEDQINHVIGKLMMQFDLEYDAFREWEGVMQ